MTHGKTRSLTAACLLVTGLSLAAGCDSDKKAQTRSPLPAEFHQKQWPRQEVPVAHLVRRDYRLREGDLLEIIYHVRHQRNVAYRIKLQDIIQIRFPFHPNLNQVNRFFKSNYSNRYCNSDSRKNNRFGRMLIW